MSVLRVVGRVIALFLILLFVVVTPALALAYNTQRVILDGDFLQRTVSDPRLFETAISESARSLARYIPRNPLTQDMPIARLDAQEWESILRIVTPPAGLQQWAADAVQAFYRWRDRGGYLLEEVVIPFGDMRDNLVNDPQQTVLRTLTAAQPPCGGGQEPLAGPDDLIPRCRPGEAGLEPFYRDLSQRWEEQPREVWQQLWPPAVGRYPDNTPVSDYVADRVGSPEWSQRPAWRLTSWGFNTARGLLLLFLVLQGVIALGTIALLAARNWAEAMRWIGGPLALAGLFTLLLGLAGLVGGHLVTLSYHPEETAITWGPVADDLIRAFADELWPPMFAQGGVMILIGLALWIPSFFLPRRLAALPHAPPAG